MRYLPDTNVLIALTNRRDRNVLLRVREHSQDIVLSSIVYHELCWGAFGSARREHNLAEIAALNFAIIPFGAEDARAAAELRSTLRQRGLPIGPYDVLIAGQALARDLTLVTNNMREFARVDGLKLADWAAG